MNGMQSPDQGMNPLPGIVTPEGAIQDTPPNPVVAATQSKARVNQALKATKQTTNPQQQQQQPFYLLLYYFLPQQQQQQPFNPFIG